MAREYKEFLRIPVISLLEAVWSILFFEYNWFLEVMLNKVNTEIPWRCIHVDFSTSSETASNGIVVVWFS